MSFLVRRVYKPNIDFPLICALRCSHQFRTLLTTGHQGILARLKSRQLLLAALPPYIDLHAYGVKLLQCRNHSRPKRSRCGRPTAVLKATPDSLHHEYSLIDHIHEREASLHLPSLVTLSSLLHPRQMHQSPNSMSRRVQLLKMPSSKVGTRCASHSSRL